MSMAILSIITVVYNAEQTIEETIKSVINFKKQYGNKIEYIIIDGKSTDSTLDIINYYKNNIDILISEADQGIYDAMNKGWNISQGKYIYYLGADDTLIALPMFELSQSQEDFLYGNVIMSNGTIFYNRYDNILRSRNMMHHQSLFTKRSLCNKNPFNTNYVIYADYDFVLRCYRKQASGKYINLIIAKYNLNGASGVFQPKEHFQVIKNNFGFFQSVLAFLRWKLGLGNILMKIRKLT